MSQSENEDQEESMSKRESNKPMKRFNNGHKTFNWREQEFLKEIYNGERTSNEKFNDKIQTRRKPRNPLLSEDTPREGPDFKPTTELYLPSQTMVSPFSPKLSNRTNLDRRDDCTCVDMALTLRKRKNKIDSELKLLDQYVEYKTKIMNESLRK